MTTQLPVKHRFKLPEGIIYLDGNSLGPLACGVSERVEAVVTEEWGGQLIRGWNDAQWMDQPSRVGNRIGEFIGAAAGSVVMGDTLSIKVFQALAAALKLQPQRRVILSDRGNFPTDLYMAEGLIKALDKGYELRVVEPEDVESAIDESVAVVMLTQVDYRTGRVHNMHKLTQLTHQAGATSVWDLAHSAGAIPVDVDACGCEFAVGCTYKYLNGGPGAPAFIYVRPDLIATVEPVLSGWLGHDKPFAFEPDYRPATGIDRMRVGTPSVLQLSALEASLEVWEGVSMQQVRQASIELSELFIQEVESRCPALRLGSPREAAERGSQVSFLFEHGYAAMQALISQGVIGDFRAPNVMRFGFTPLYIDQSDVVTAVDRLVDILDNRLWEEARFQTVSRVT